MAIMPVALERQPVTFSDKQISLQHGAGGEASRRLVEELIRPLLTNDWLEPLSDAATLEPLAGRLAVTTDSFVVQPLEFPGGSIGELAVNGTVNDLAMVGAQPVAITVGLILEAGLSTAVLRRELEALAAAARQVGVPIVAGDTKVVEHGRADGMYINTTGLGTVSPQADLAAGRVQPGDRVLLSGPIGNHGMAIMLARAQLDIEAAIRSDTRPLAGLALPLVEQFGVGVRWLRDATRGGVATVLNELARDIERTIVIEEEAIPLDADVRGACELLGLDPLHVANEGQFVAVVAQECAAAALELLQNLPGGERACLLGVVNPRPLARVVARTSYGGQRVIDMLIGDPLPRIC